MVMYKVEINVAISKREDIVREDILNIFPLLVLQPIP